MSTRLHRLPRVLTRHPAAAARTGLWASLLAPQQMGWGWGCPGRGGRPGVCQSSLSPPLPVRVPLSLRQKPLCQGPMSAWRWLRPLPVARHPGCVLLFQPGGDSGSGPKCSLRHRPPQCGAEEREGSQASPSASAPPRLAGPEFTSPGHWPQRPRPWLSPHPGALLPPPTDTQGGT